MLVLWKQLKELEQNYLYTNWKLSTILFKLCTFLTEPSDGKILSATNVSSADSE